MDEHPIKTVVVVGGGSAGFMAALALKMKLPDIAVTVIRSKDIGIIGVGEGSTVPLTRFLHQYLGVHPQKFHDLARPTWKLGLKFIWGPRPHFYYTFGGKQPDARIEGMTKNVGFYCDDDPTMVYDQHGALMEQNKVFGRAPHGGPVFMPDLSFSYHFENERFVQFLEGFAAAAGIRIVEDTVREVARHPETGDVLDLSLASGTTTHADLYVDCSGFTSLLLGKKFGEPFESFRSSLFCDRAVVGGWARGADELITPYTTCETMDSGWCWQIEHEHRVNRGYVYCSSFISDEEAEREFRRKNPKLGPTRIVRFTSGCYRRSWVGNVVAIGNASGFVEPLEATALGVIAMQSWLLADTLIDADRVVRPSLIAEFNQYHIRNWRAIRGCIAMHYKYNTRLDTPFWRECRERTDLAGAERVVAYYQDNGPSLLHRTTIHDPHDQFQNGGYVALLLGMRVPFRRTYTPPERERKHWAAFRQKQDEVARRAMTVREALDVIRSPRWNWGPRPAERAGAARPTVFAMQK